jgi:hypothetical protein
MRHWHSPLPGHKLIARLGRFRRAVLLVGSPNTGASPVEVSRVPWPWLRIALVAVDGSAAVTAIGGGIALATGLEGDRFPTEWLRGTPFSSYLVPGLILATVVGGSAAAATVATLRRPTTGSRASMLAGLVMVGWIVGEILILTGDGEVVSPTEVLYLAAGLAMIGLGLAVGQTAPTDPLRRESRRAALKAANR